MKKIKTIKTEYLGKTHAVFFTRTYREDWGYMGMRDYSTWEPTGEYGIDVVKFEYGRADNSDAGIRKDSFTARGFGKDMANRIWWNVKNGISYEALKAAMKAEGFLKTEA